MKLIIPVHILRLVEQALRKAGKREIGGVLVAEHIGGDGFRLVDLSVQATRGSATHFVRDPAEHRAFLDAFFDRTGHDYARYNYFGEWHSHTVVPPVPSTEDCDTMDRIVRDPDTHAAFAVLLVARLGFWGTLTVSATAFRAGYAPDPVDILDEDGRRHSKIRHLRVGPQRRLIAI
jgi:hypothetical protein